MQHDWSQVELRRRAESDRAERRRNMITSPAMTTTASLWVCLYDGIRAGQTFLLLASLAWQCNGGRDFFDCMEEFACLHTCVDTWWRGRQGLSPMRASLIGLAHIHLDSEHQEIRNQKALRETTLGVALVPSTKQPRYLVVFDSFFSFFPVCTYPDSSNHPVQ
jgi:hypothetical protein